MFMFLVQNRKNMIPVRYEIGMDLYTNIVKNIKRKVIVKDVFTESEVIHKQKYE